VNNIESSYIFIFSKISTLTNGDKMKKLLLGAILCLSTYSVVAGEQIGKVVEIKVRASDGVHLFFVSGTSQRGALCSAMDGRWVIQDENSVVGEAQFKMLLTAYTTGKTVKVVGSGTCARWEDAEDVDVLSLLNRS
jgi:hypothetical protein